MRKTLYILLCAGGCLLGAVACNDLKLSEETAVPFDVTATSGDGRLKPDGTLAAAPQVSIAFNSQDAMSEYTLYYSIDEGERQQVDGVVPGAPLDLGEALYDALAYGRHTVSGSIVRKISKSEVEFSTSYWMKYNPMTVSKIHFDSTEGDVLFENNCVLNVNATGNLTLVYSPADSYAVLDVACSDESILAFNRQGIVFKNGTLKVPFSVKKTGNPTVTVTLTNGDEQKKYSCVVACSPAINRINVKLSATKYVWDGGYVDTILSLTQGDENKLYTIKYYINNTLEAELNSVSFKTHGFIEKKFLMDTDDYPSDNKLTIVVEGTDVYTVPVTVEHSFILKDIFFYTNGRSNLKIYGPNSGQLTLNFTCTAVNDYTMSFMVNFSSVPAEFRERIWLGSNTSGGTVLKNSDGTLFTKSFTSGGTHRLYFYIHEDDDDLYENLYSFDVFVNEQIDIILYKNYFDFSYSPRFSGISVIYEYMGSDRSGTDWLDVDSPGCDFNWPCPGRIYLSSKSGSYDDSFGDSVSDFTFRYASEEVARQYSHYVSLYYRTSTSQGPITLPSWD